MFNWGRLTVNNVFNNSVRTLLFALALFFNTTADAGLGMVNYTNQNFPSASTLSSCPTNILDSLRVKNYYLASKDNMDFGNCKLQELGHGNPSFISMNGDVTECYPSTLKSAILQYGKDIQYYEDNCDQQYRTPGVDCELKKRIFDDIENFNSLLKADKVAMPAEVCRQNLKELISHIQNIRYVGVTFNGDPEEEITPLRREFFRNVFSKVTSNEYYDNLARKAATANEYMDRHSQGIFPGTARVAAATAEESDAGECMNGAFTRYVVDEDYIDIEDAKKSAVCVGNNVEGPYIADYIAARPETSNWKRVFNITSDVRFVEDPSEIQDSF